MKKLDQALLVAINTHNLTLTQNSINELEELANAVNITTVSKVIQNLNNVDPRYYVGSGKLKEIKQIIDDLEINILITDDTLSPTQLRNLENFLEIQVIDRSFLILQIFSQRAQSKQAILEVSLAQKQYLLPRLLGMGKVLSRQGGGSFNAKGPGETKLELDRRKLTKEIHMIKQQLIEIKKHRDLTVKKRKNNEVPVVALVGYTNAGKSSLMNYFVNHWGSDKTLVLAQDMLFSTIDTKAKRIKRNNSSAFILIDTVGFIAKLPNELIASFESTLNDIKSADLIIHVIDGLDVDPYKVAFVKNILKILKMEQIPRITVVSKEDLLTKRDIALSDDYYFISTETGFNIDVLLNEIEASIFNDARISSFIIPYDKGYIFNELKESTTIIESDFLEDGIHVKAILSPKAFVRIKSLIDSKN